MITPKFLTAEIARTAVKQAIRITADGINSLELLLRRQAFHIVVLGPSVEGARADCHDIKPALIYEYSVGKDLWTDKYDDVAEAKALQLWNEHQDGGTDIQPHLLFPGDTIYWGGVKRQGIVVACSGVQPWFDRMIASIVADMIIALGYDAWMRSQEKQAVDQKQPGAGWIT